MIKLQQQNSNKIVSLDLRVDILCHQQQVFQSILSLSLFLVLSFTLWYGMTITDRRLNRRIIYQVSLFENQLLSLLHIYLLIVVFIREPKVDDSCVCHNDKLGKMTYISFVFPWFSLNVLPNLFVYMHKKLYIYISTYRWVITIELRDVTILVELVKLLSS